MKNISLTTKTKIVSISVNFNSDSFALRFIKGLSALILDGIEFTIILVDNTERYNSDIFFNQIHNINNSVICIKPPENLGYFGGARLGLSEYLKNTDYPDWLIVSNVDIDYQDQRFMQNILVCNNRENVGVLAPSIWSLFSLKDINPEIVIRPSKIKMKYYKYIFSNYILTNCYEMLSAVNLKNKMYLKKLLFAKTSAIYSVATEQSSGKWKYIYAPHGSCMVFSKLYFLCGGSLNYPKMLFNEEIYVAETVRKLGLKVVYYPQLKVIADEHVSTGIIRSRKIYSYMAESAKYIYETYFK